MLKLCVLLFIFVGVLLSFEIEGHTFLTYMYVKIFLEVVEVFCILHDYVGSCLNVHVM